MAKSEKGSEKDTKEKDETTAEATPKEKRRRDILYGKGGVFVYSEIIKIVNCRRILGVTIENSLINRALSMAFFRDK